MNISHRRPTTDQRERCRLIHCLSKQNAIKVNRSHSVIANAPLVCSLKRRTNKFSICLNCLNLNRFLVIQPNFTL